MSFRDSNTNNRIVHLDILRIIAILSVIVMHSTGAVQRYYSNGIDSVFLLTNIPNAITRFSVPLFLMISGRLMINRGHDYRFLLRKVAHYIIIFFFWSLIYSIVLIEQPWNGIISFKAFLINTLDESWAGFFHFWFIFLICGIYVILPIIEIIVNNISKRIKRYYIVLSIICCFIIQTLLNFSFVNIILGTHFNSFLVGFLNLYAFYFMLGYWLKDYNPNNLKLLWIGMVGGIFFNAIIGNYSSWIAGDRVVSFIDAQAPSTLLVCVCMFVLSKRIKVKEGKGAYIIEVLSELSFGVYLIHMLIIEIIKKSFPVIKSSLAACSATIIITIIAGFGISWLLWRNRITRVLIK